MIGLLHVQLEFLPGTPRRITAGFKIETFKIDFGKDFPRFYKQQQEKR